MDKLMEAMRRDGAIDAIGRPTKVVSCIRAGVSDARGVGMGSVSYTHLTLPTIYSV